MENIATHIKMWFSNFQHAIPLYHGRNQISHRRR